MSLLLPLVVALSSVALGAALAFAAGTRGLEPARWLGTVAALLAAFQLVPEAQTDLGWWALLVAAIGFAIPRALEEIPAIPADAHEVAFAGLLTHQLLDGVGLAVLQEHEGVLLALGAHIVPMTAAVILAFEPTPRTVAVRGGMMAAAIALGVAIGTLIPADAMGRVEPILAAAAAGLLVHIAFHTDHNHEHGHTHE